MVLFLGRTISYRNEQEGKFLSCSNVKHKFYIYEGKSISKLQMDIELKQIRVLI
jgi:hypothetical protein